PCGPRLWIDRDPVPFASHGVGAEDPARTGPTVVAHGGCCDRDRSILAQSFGTGAGRLFDSFCRAHGIRREDVTTDHVQALQDFLSRALMELSGVVGGPAAHGLQVQFEAASSVLRSFAAQGAVEIARGKWPSRRSSETDVELIVTAADYWKGKEMEE